MAISLSHSPHTHKHTHTHTHTNVLTSLDIFSGVGFKVVRGEGLEAGSSLLDLSSLPKLKIGFKCSEQPSHILGRGPSKVHSPSVQRISKVMPRHMGRSERANPPGAIWRAWSATHAQIDGFLRQLPYKCHQNQVSSVGHLLNICPWVASRVAGMQRGACSRGGLPTSVPAFDGA